MERKLVQWQPPLSDKLSEGSPNYILKAAAYHDIVTPFETKP